MGFRFQRRVNFGRGVGLNVSKSGISPSVRTRYGSLGTKGFSIRTGIPGLTYRQGFGRKSGGGLIVGLILLVVALLPLLIQVAVVIIRVLWVVAVWLVQFLIIAPFNLFCWLVQSLADLIVSRMNPASSPGASAAVPTPQPRQLTDRRDVQVAGTILLVTVVLAVFKLVNMSASDSGHAASQPAESAQNSAPPQTEAGQPHRAASPQRRRRPYVVRRIAPELARRAAADEKPETSAPAAVNVPNTTDPPNDVLASVKARDPQAAAQIETFCANATVGTNDPAVAQKCDQREAAAWTRIVVLKEFPQLDPTIAKTCSQPPFPSNSYVAEEACAKYELHKDVPEGQ